MSPKIGANNGYIHKPVSSCKNIVTAEDLKPKTILQQENLSAETPAYVLNIETDFPDKQNYRVEDAEKEFFQKMLEKMEKLSASLDDDTLKSEGAKVWRAPGNSIYCSIFIQIRYAMDRGDLVPKAFDDVPLEEVQKFFDKYYNVAEDIEKGGKEALLAYNLMFAGTAAYLDEKLSDATADKFIGENGYSAETYKKLKDFAADLQEKSSVYVSLDFQYVDYKEIDEAHSIAYSYMGAMCSIGVQALEFMADHREADDVWINVAQGKYQNAEELLQGLCDSGHADLADMYTKQILGVEEKDKEELSRWTFQSKNGAFWDATVGYRKAWEEKPRQEFEDFKLKYFSDADARVTYTNEQLRLAYSEGKKEGEKFIRCVSKGVGTPSEEEDTKAAELDRKRKQIQSLRKQLMELNREIRDLKSSMLAEENKSEKIKQIQQRQQTIQIQIEDILNSMIDK